MSRRTIQNLVNQVAVRARLNKTESRQSVDAIFEAIRDILVQQDEIRIPRFGTFFVKKRSWIESRDPRTGKKILAPPKDVPCLEFSDFVRIPVNKGNEDLKFREVE